MRRDDRTRRPRGLAPRVDGLEPRLLLYATTGGSWSHPAVITYSFVPDGTNIAGYGSNLFSAFNARWSTASWESAFQEAAAIWEQAANINLVQVSDNGTPMGGGLYQQGDPGMGDIRISGLTSAALGTGILAYTLLPPPINGCSQAGDIVFNTSQPWNINSDYDLLTVAIHEFGHALGMDHSTISTADMYATYNGIKQSLTSDDTAGIDSIYGPRQPDWFMTYYNNATPSNAFDLTPYFDAQGRIAVQGLDAQTSKSQEWFKATVPANTNGTMVVTEQSTNISALDPGVAVYDSSLHFVGYAYGNSGSFTGGTATLKINGVVPGRVYYIDTGAAVGGPAGAGNYGLLINFGSSPQYPIPLTLTLVADTSSSGGGLAEKPGGDDHGHDVGPIVARLSGGDALMIPGHEEDAPVESTAPAIPLWLIAPTDLDGGTGSDPLPTPAGPRRASRLFAWSGSIGAG